MKRGTLEHPKMLELCDRLHVPLYAAAGILESLWHFTAKFTPAGDIGHFSNAAVARSIQWDGDPDGLFVALQGSGWIDADPEHRLVIHDWYDHADDALHMAMARAGRRFCGGQMPRLARIEKRERGRIKRRFSEPDNGGPKGRKAAPLSVEHGDGKKPVRTDSAPPALGVRTDSAPPRPAPPFPSSNTVQEESVMTGTSVGLATSARETRDDHDDEALTYLLNHPLLGRMLDPAVVLRACRQIDSQLDALHVLHVADAILASDPGRRAELEHGNPAKFLRNVFTIEARELAKEAIHESGRGVRSPSGQPTLDAAQKRAAQRAKWDAITGGSSSTARVGGPGVVTDAPVRKAAAAG